MFTTIVQDQLGRIAESVCNMEKSSERMRENLRPILWAMSHPKVSLGIFLTIIYVMTLSSVREIIDSKIYYFLNVLPK